MIIQLIISIALLILYFYFRPSLFRLIEKFGQKNNLHSKKTTALVKTTNIVSFVGLVLALAIVWGYTVQSLYVASFGIFTLIGIAFFAVWSILSNITSGIIMFFKFPMGIGDKVDFMEIGGATGIVQDISLFHVILRRDDDSIIAIPNNVVMQKVIGVKVAEG